MASDMAKVEKLCTQLHIGYSNFNTTLFCATAQALVAGNQVGTVSKTPTLQGMKTTGETFYPPALSQISKFRGFLRFHPGRGNMTVANQKQ